MAEVPCRRLLLLESCGAFTVSEKFAFWRSSQKRTIQYQEDIIKVNLLCSVGLRTNISKE